MVPTANNRTYSSVGRVHADDGTLRDVSALTDAERQQLRTEISALVSSALGTYLSEHPEESEALCRKAPDV